MINSKRRNREKCDKHEKNLRKQENNLRKCENKCSMRHVQHTELSDTSNTRNDMTRSRQMTRKILHFLPLWIKQLVNLSCKGKLRGLGFSEASVSANIIHGLPMGSLNLSYSVLGKKTITQTCANDRVVKEHIARNHIVHSCSKSSMNSLIFK